MGEGIWTMKLVRQSASLAAFVTFALVAASCGSSSETGSDQAPENSSAQSADPDGVADSAAPPDESGDTTATDDAPEEGKRGGTLVIASSQVPRTLNGAVQSGYATALPGTQLNAGLLLYTDSFEPQPYLAESWEVSDDGLHVTVHLVDGAVFHDGEPITSEDVAFSIITERDNHPFKTMFAPVESVDTPDPLTAVINLSTPHPAILLAMSPALLPIIPKHIFDDGQDITTHPRNTEDFVGSGPFKLTEYDPASVVRLERFDDFFIPDRPYLDEIIIQITSDVNSIALGLENGSIDLSLTQGPANTVRLQGNDDLVVSEKGHEALGQLNWLEFNLDDPILGIKEVRQAIAYAIDNTFVSENIELGLTQPATTAIAPTLPFFNAEATTYDQDIDKAKQLLSDAGFEEGDIDLTIDFLPPAFQPHAEYVVQALEEIGINTELSVSPDFPTWAERIASGNYQMNLNNVWNWGDPVIGVDRTYLSDNRVGVIWTNNTGYNNPEVDTLLEQAGMEMDETKRKELYDEFQETVNNDVPIAYLTNNLFWQVMSPRIQNPPQGIWGEMSPMLDVWLSE